MALDLDAFETWRAIAREPDLFASIRADAAKSARGLLVKMLKSKSVGLAQAADIRKALGKETFGLILDGMKDAEVKALVTRFDRNNAEATAATGEWRSGSLSRPAGRGSEAGRQTGKGVPKGSPEESWPGQSVVHIGRRGEERPIDIKDIHVLIAPRGLVKQTRKPELLTQNYVAGTASS